MLKLNILARHGVLLITLHSTHPLEDTVQMLKKAKSAIQSSNYQSRLRDLDLAKVYYIELVLVPRAVGAYFIRYHEV